MTARIPEFDAFVADKPEEERWELINGKIVVQATPVETHQIILGNLLEHLRSAAGQLGPECRAIPGINVRLDTVDTYSPVPDILVRCGSLSGTNRRSDPIVIAEVLSPSTADTDRGPKLIFYKLIPSLAAYLITYANERRVEMWERDGETWRFHPFARAEDFVPLCRLKTAIPLSDIYAGTDILTR